MFYANYVDDMGQHTSPVLSGPIYELIACSALGYFIWDTVLCIVDRKTFGAVFVLHGLFCLLTYGIMVLVGTSPIEHSLPLLYEVSLLPLRISGRYNVLFPATRTGRCPPLHPPTSLYSSCACRVGVSYLPITSFLVRVASVRGFSRF